MGRLKLWHLNVALYGLLAVLSVAHRAELRWAAHAFPVFVAGGFPPLLEASLYHEAVQRMRQGGDPNHTRALLERSLAIDPNTKAMIVLAESYGNSGDSERALEHWERYLELDPLYLHAYLQAAQMYRKEGREEERRRLLERGASHFRAQVGHYRPRPDPTVEAPFNQKASRVYDYHRRAIRALVGRLRAYR